MRRRVRHVGEEGSKSEGAANGRERERAGGRRSRTGKGGGDPGREVGRSETGKRWEVVWA